MASRVTAAVRVKPPMPLAEIPETWFLDHDKLQRHISNVIGVQRRLSGADIQLDAAYDSAVMCGFGLLDASRLRKYEINHAARYLCTDKMQTKMLDPANVIGSLACPATVVVCGVMSVRDMYALLLLHELCVHTSASLVMSEVRAVIAKVFENSEVGTMSELAQRRKALDSLLCSRERDPMFVSEISDMMARTHSARKACLLKSAADALRKVCDAPSAGDEAVWFAKAAWVPNMASVILAQALRITVTRIQARIAEAGVWTSETDHDTEATRREDFEDVLDVGVRWLVQELNEITTVAVEGYAQG